MSGALIRRLQAGSTAAPSIPPRRALALTASSNENINLATAGGGAYAQISLGSNGVNTYSGTLTPAGNTYYLGGGGGTLVLANKGALVDSTSAARGLVVNGNVTLAGSNSYSGGTTLDAGTLNIAGDASLGAVPGNPVTNVTFAGNATPAGRRVRASPLPPHGTWSSTPVSRPPWTPTAAA